MVNGKKLTKKQKKAADKISTLIEQLRSEGVEPLLHTNNLMFMRDADISEIVLDKNYLPDTNIYYSTKTKISDWNP